MTTIPPHPGLSGLAAREAAAARIANAPDPSAAAREEYPEFMALLEEAHWPPPTTPADVARAADDDADHIRSDFTRPPRPVCGCCGPQQCCCPCHEEES